MPLDEFVSKYPTPQNFPREGFWSPASNHCGKCSQSVQFAQGEACDRCGLKEDGTKI